MPTTTKRNEQITALYTDFADGLRRRINANVNTDPANIEDACAKAWTYLLERPDIDPAREDVRGWLFLTARHAAIKAHQRAHDRRHAAENIEQFDCSAHDTTALLDHDERVQDLRQLKAREQRELLLLAAGYSRQEIADLTASSMTAINRRLTEGRAHLRRLAERRDHDAR